MVNGKVVVVVVQDLFFSVRMTDSLRAMGHQVLSVADERELRVLLGSTRPNLVILDLQASGVTALGIVTAVNDLVKGRPVPVLAFGPHTDLKKRSEAMQAGCRRVVAKSMIYAELPRLVDSMLRA